MIKSPVRYLLSWLFFINIVLAPGIIRADDGYRLWLKYDKITDNSYLKTSLQTIRTAGVIGYSPVLQAAREELHNGLSGLLGTTLPVSNSGELHPGSVIAGTPSSVAALRSRPLRKELAKLDQNGYIIREIKTGSGSGIIVAANEDTGVLYGVFHFLRLLQTQTGLKGVHITSSPKLQWRILNHWDNLDGSVERGYAGQSLWKWEELPDKIDRRYKDYARANASVGINGVVLNNVNANPKIFSREYLEKTAVLARVFRPYGIHLILSANFTAPIIMGGLDTADPLNPKVQRWWKEKTEEIYELIPDFGGFLVKANSEGQPGPKDYHRSHAEGANMIADVLAPHGGVLMWRAFVYERNDTDRAKQAYNEFKPFDGEFRENVMVQVKNGPIDFQPREPFHPLFGGMPETSLMMEFQITQEYLGFSTHLVYLAPLYQEVLESDTYAEGKGSTVAKVLDGSLQGQKITGMAGVANTGSDTNWTGHPFAQSNWFAFGRLAWNHELSAEEIATDWIKMTFADDSSTVQTIRDIMMGSREALVNYETPLGLHVLCDLDHFGPLPQFRSNFHRADTLGLGYDRSSTGSNAVEQYFSPLRDSLDNIKTTPENLLTWFHHVPWDYKMASGRTFWEELCHKYYSGVKTVRQMQRKWASLKGKIDAEKFDKVSKLLTEQEKEAVRWRDVCLKYFSKFSQRSIPPRYVTNQ